MIKGIQGTGHVRISGGNSMVPYVNQNVSNPAQGMVRVWGSDMQVYDGASWVTISSSYATVELDTEAQKAIDWAKRKMQEEKDLHERMERHPGLKQAYEAFKIMDALTLEEKKNEQPA